MGPAHRVNGCHVGLAAAHGFYGCVVRARCDGFAKEGLVRGGGGYQCTQYVVARLRDGVVVSQGAARKLRQILARIVCTTDQLAAAVNALHARGFVGKRAHQLHPAGQLADKGVTTSLAQQHIAFQPLRMYVAGPAQRKGNVVAFQRRVSAQQRGQCGPKRLQRLARREVHRQCGLHAQVSAGTRLGTGRLGAVAGAAKTGLSTGLKAKWRIR